MSTVRFTPLTLTAPAALRAPAASRPIRWRDVLAAVIEEVMTWHERVRQRRQLQSLSDHMLRDIGIGRADVELEAAKPFWQP
jgi:uncharacterized protein YjiS (DUF1127 family)